VPVNLGPGQHAVAEIRVPWATGDRAAGQLRDPVAGWALIPRAQVPASRPQVPASRPQVPVSTAQGPSVRAARGPGSVCSSRPTRGVLWRGR
jgi:hypothetical protein